MKSSVTMLVVLTLSVMLAINSVSGLRTRALGNEYFRALEQQKLESERLKELLGMDDMIARRKQNLEVQNGDLSFGRQRRLNFDESRGDSYAFKRSHGDKRRYEFSDLIRRLKALQGDRNFSGRVHPMRFGLGGK